MLRERLRALPKAELHVHLDGSLRPATAIELAREARVELPASDPDGLARAMRAEDAGDLVSYLARFDLLVSLLQSPRAVERAACELAEDAAAEGARRLEVRYCPALLTREGMSRARAVEASLRGLERARADHGIRSGLIVCALRNLPPATSVELAELAVGYRGRGVVGFDLAGPESGHPPAEHAEAFRVAREGGLGITVHAGEAYGPDSIRQALDDCGAVRIGHGTRLFEDPELMARVRDEGIVLEVCLTSNVQTGAVDRYEAHPLRRYVDAGVPVALCTDNRLVSGTTLVEEYEHAQRALGLSWSELEGVARTGLEGAFGEGVGGGAA